jgi:hypothetical protein
MEVHSRSETAVFGPLPRLHQLLVLVTTLAVGIVSGIWIAQFTSAPVASAAGAAWGALAGGLLGFVLLHDFHHRTHAVRARRH